MKASIRISIERPNDGEDAHRVTWMELFFDLVFVFAITQVSHVFLDRPQIGGLGEVALLLLALWWVWIYTAWVTNWLNPAHPAVRLLIFGLMFVGLVLASAIPEAFGDRGLLFACCIVVMQLGRTMFTIAALWRRNRANAINFVRIGSWEAVAAGFWVAGGLAEPHVRIWFWIAAVLFDGIGPVFRYAIPLLGRTPVHVWTVSGSHLAERAAQFVIIMLGESIVETGSAFADGPITVERSTALVLAFVGTAFFYGLYFAHRAEYGSRRIESATENGHIARSAYSFVHVLFVEAIMLSAVADDLLLSAHGERSQQGLPVVVLPLLMAAAASIYLVGMSMFNLAVSGEAVRPPLVGVAVLVALGGVELLSRAIVPPMVVALLVAAVLVGVLVLDAVRFRRGRHQATST